MYRTLVSAILVSLLFAAQGIAADQRLMTAPQFEEFLNRLDRDVPVWNAAFRRVDPVKINTPYAIGAQIVQDRDIGLIQVEYVHRSVAKLRVKRTVSEELSLQGSLTALFETMTAIVGMEVASSINLSSLETLAEELGALRILISNDLDARVDLLEKGSCP